MIKKLLVVALLVTSTFAHAQQVVRVNSKSDTNAPYAIDMLKLALANVDKPYRLEVDASEATQARVNEEVSRGGRYDVAFSSTSAEMEESLLPVRIPLFKGLLGYRIFIINADTQSQFDRVSTLNDLRQFTVGQGRTWGDTSVLEANGFNVVKTTKYPGLFYMVEGGRFDAFPRGVHEPFVELDARPELNLAVERNLMLSYKMPFYFFTSKSNTELAKDIETGLNRAIENGSFDAAFLGSPLIQDVIQKANMKDRIVFPLDNPFLHPDTPLERAELWFDPKDLR